MPSACNLKIVIVIPTISKLAAAYKCMNQIHYIEAYNPRKNVKN